VRIAAIELTGATGTLFGDAADYIATAKAICTQQVYPERGNLPFFRAPGLPLFIAAVTVCDAGRVRAIKYGLAVCDALTSVLLMVMAGIVWRGSTNIAGLLAALHPFFVASVTDVRSEPLFMMLLVAGIWLVLRGNPAAAGVALALSALVRPTGLLCIPLLAAFVWWRDRRWRAALALPFVAALTLAPWVARNAIRFRELIVVNDAGGFNLWRGTHPELLRIVRLRDRAAFAVASWEFETRTVAETARAIDAVAKTPRAREREWTRLALENVRRDPPAIVRATAWKAAAYWRPWLHPAEHGPKAVLLSAVVFLGLYLAGAIGLVRHFDRGLVRAVLIFLVALWLAHLPYVPSIRLRMPLVDPLLIVFASARPAWLHRAGADADTRSRSAPR
jgi:hypothetical protein